MFYAVKNLTEKTLFRCEPWAFKPTMEISAQIRHDKQSRQEFYQTVGLEWQFYSAIEPHNSNQRVSKDNPPKFLGGVPADYDVKLPEARIDEVISSLKIKPAYVERSLGGNARLVWTFPRPLPIDDYDFCTFVLQRAVKWLCLDMLPGLDENAVTDPSRLLCNGCEWRETGHGPIAEADLQAFFVSCGKDFRFQTADPTEIPLDIVEKALREKYPNFNWPGDFTVESQGPSFWIDGSTSPLSAIVKKDGMFTFSGHAGKSFFSYADLLGKEFVEKFKTESISSATADVYWDSTRVWRKIKGIYQSGDKDEFRNHLLVDCRLNDKKDKTGTSPQDRALNHIYNAGRIAGGAPFVFQKPGIIDYNGDRALNIYRGTPLIPADELTPWGAEGRFPWLSSHFDFLLDPIIQRDYLFTWLQYAYKAALDWVPLPGQNIVFMGPPACGKTLTSREIIAPMLGGFTDASEYLSKGGGFNSQLLEKPVWCSDDDMMIESSITQTNYQGMLKKVAANQSHVYHKKFEVPVMVQWCGRIIITLNCDYASSRTLGSLDNSSLDKICIFRCSEVPRLFPDRVSLGEIIRNELPYFARYILAYKIPAHVIPDARYGLKSYHEPRLLAQVHQGSKSAPFKEVLIESLRVFFQGNKDATEWRGTLSALTKLMHSDPYNEIVLRSLRLEQTNRYMEAIQREGILKMSVETGELKTRIWIFPRFESLTPPDADQPPTDTSTEFSK